jgi:N-acetylneuraminate synthase
MYDFNKLIIAELGINHDGDKQKARDLIDAAVSAGVGAVKFQYRNLENAYGSDKNKEIGDEIVSEQIIKCFLSVEEIFALVADAKKLGLLVGISFFDVKDVLDFGKEIEMFDFFKIPSSELTHSHLTETLLSFGKPVYISTGCHDETEISDIFNSLTKDNWIAFHCVSNYPTSLENAKLGYIRHLQKTWQRPVGYSSHDSEWEVVLIALAQGASIIERHITLDKDAPGLDHSSSSTPDEFRKIVAFTQSFDTIISGEDARLANQGERINRQNLGRSLYASCDLQSGRELDLSDFTYQAPFVGLNYRSASKYAGSLLTKNIVAGAPLLASSFTDGETLSDEILEFANVNKIGIPVRYHDFPTFLNDIPVNTFEFHLSQRDLLDEAPLSLISNGMNISIHMPDYVSSNFLFDPFSTDPEQRKQSFLCMEAATELTKRIQDHCGEVVPLIASIPMLLTPSNDRFDLLTELIESLKQEEVCLLPQWLPPVAWYFGGSIPLEFFNNESDIENINSREIPFCLDVSHYLLGANCFGLSKTGVIGKFGSQIKHIHLSDASGIDGEGLLVGEGEPENLGLIQDAVSHVTSKIIEVWQGHLNEGEGFKRMMSRLYTLHQGCEK